MEPIKELMEIQQELRVKKGKFNKFGNFYYRSLENIFEEVKPLLKRTETVLILSDEIVEVGGENYIKAFATLINKNGDKITVTASAREDKDRKKMDSPQLTGSASSYARKYALGGLFDIDDNQDADDISGRPSKSSSAKKEKTVSGDLVSDVLSLVKAKSIPDDIVRKEITKLGFDRLTKMDTENTIKLIDVLSKY